MGTFKCSPKPFFFKLFSHTVWLSVGYTPVGRVPVASCVGTPHTPLLAPAPIGKK